MRLAFGVVSKTSFFLKSIMVLTLAASVVAADVGAAMAAKSSAIVIDAKTGKTLYSSDANGRRYPASLTKMMTLYLVFEALAQGRIKKGTQVVFSANAAAEPPTKLGVRAGSSVSVETAILSMVTKSANDSSTALGEMLGGSESNFARMMTAKARALGMNGTVFRNANGLPNPGQFTTARDMATLGIALREHYPQYYSYFSTRSFMYGSRRINGHNRLLGRVKGVDGIKTGYTRASGFNLVSSVSDGNRRLVAVVMGGSSGGSRDAQMAGLIKTYMPKTSGKGGGGDLVAKADGSATMALAKVLFPKKSQEVAVVEDNGEDAIETIVATATPAPAPRKKIVAVETVAPVVASVAAYAEPEAVDPVNTASVPQGWTVQVASSPSKTEAQSTLDRVARQASNALAKSSSFTVPFKKDGVTYFRARFGGFGSQTAALNACKALKKKKIECYAVQQ